MPLDAMRTLLRHDWPRNVRELSKAAAATVADNRRPGPLVWPAPSPRETRPPLPREQVIREALDAHDHVQNRTAAALGVSPTTLDRWRRKLGIVRPRDLQRDQIEQALAAAGGDLEAAARALRISLRGLQLRWRELQDE
jgi:DNA-binding NtrC family response regulator